MLALFAVAVALIGCGHRDDADARAPRSDSAGVSPNADPRTKEIVVADEARVMEMERTAPAGLDACVVAGHVTAALDTIIRWPRPLIDGDDGCVLAVLDSLADGFAKTVDAQYLEALDSISRFSDGYVSEAIWNLSDTIFAQAPRSFIGYLHERRLKRSPLEWALIGNWQLDFDESKDSVERKRLLLDRIRRLAARDSLPASLAAHLDAILREARLIP
jgi:hypothetical protein